jgi:hypothetical protein
MPKNPIVPWQLADEIAPSVERIEAEGHAIELPVLGSVTVDEARYLEYYNEKHGLSNMALIPVSQAVYSLLLLRFGGAVWMGDHLAGARIDLGAGNADSKLRVKVPSFEDVMCYGKPARMLPFSLVQQVFAFFLDEFTSNLGKPRTALTAVRQPDPDPEDDSQDGKTSTGNSSDITPAENSEVSSSDEPQSTSSTKRSQPTKTTTSGSKADAIAA